MKYLVDNCRIRQLEIIKNLVVTSREVQEILGISRARLSQLVKKQKLTPVKKNLYLLSDVMSRKDEQEKLRTIYYKPR